MSDSLRAIGPHDRQAWQQVDRLLEQEGIRRDANLDYTCGIFDGSGRLAATGSSFGSTLRCFAVDRSRQGEGLLNRLVTHLTDRLAERGRFRLFVYTKTATAGLFQDLGFHEIARVDGTVSFLENLAGGFQSFCAGLAGSRRPGRSAAVVMNANPFTLGHRYLAEKAAGENDTVHLFVLEEDAGPIPFAVRWKLVTEGVADLANVICHKSGPYIISAATFPSYFLRDEAAAIEAHARLDLALFRPIAEALGVTARYVGQEPTSRVTGLYNRVMQRQLPAMGLECVEVPRLTRDGAAVSASTVRKLLHDGQVQAVRPLVPASTWRYLASPEAEPVIRAIRASREVVHY